MAFTVQVHQSPNVIEVVYPEQPSALEISDYVSRLRTAIVGLNGAPWLGLVDQRKLKMLTPDLLETLKVMNNFAAHKGMKKLARIVPDAMGSLSAWRVAKEAALHIPTQTFTDKEQALAWLVE